ncbi:DUF2141 domain-containing protein [Psychroserpens damuponensis]|uniref:DUF2141 domain-containing protein n=1 Tax=Psychroserpens damuponensis TaxID=943936 RepID=UPI00058EF7ED|nr:DUF2141 domain-containing protein [Psychroserpens damuponensis]
MKSLVLFIVLTLISTLGFSQDTKGHTLTITVENAKSDDGKIVLALNTEATFMKTQPIQSASATIKDGTAILTFENIQPGDYAIIALHDLNGNQRMDFDANGMPVESYGTSNNPRSFGPPNYGDAKFNVANKDVELSIRF